MEKLLFKNWESVSHVAFCAFLAYIILFLFIRISGKRTLAKLTAFDFVVTVTLGSTLSSMILAKVTMAEGAVALIVIISLQYLLAWSARESKVLEKLINSSPTMVFYRGEFLEDAMKKEVLTREEIYAEIRKFRMLDVDQVEAVVMELNGELTVIKKSANARHTSLKDL
ncbi:MAG: YetF domain-containing protein [Bacteroidota bacterium]